MPYLKLFDHEGRMLTETIISSPPIPHLNEEIVLEDGKHYTVKRVLHDIARSPRNGLYLGAEVTVHANNIVTCEFCDWRCEASKVNYDAKKYGGQPKCTQPGARPDIFAYCGGRLFYPNGKQYDPNFHNVNVK